MATDITLQQDELLALTGYKRPNDQLRVLLKRGFSRAYIQNGRLVLERAHYDAVCRGEGGTVTASAGRRRPQVTLPQSLLGPT